MNLTHHTLTRAAAALALGAALLAQPACTDLELDPLDTATPGVLFTDAEAYRSFIARVYAGLAVTGQSGPAGSADISSLDEGFSNYLRQYWQLQELPTDEAVIAWGDAGLPELIQGTWGSDNQFVRAMYYRIYFQVSLANEFLRESTPELLAGRGIPEAARAEIATYRAEARFLRALSLHHALDFYGSAPLYTEAQAVGGNPPEQATARELFDFVEAELAAIADELPEAGAAEYGRADRAAAWMLQARLFLNAETYVGDDRYADAAAAAERVIASGAYTLDEDYSLLFGADNHTATGVVFAIPFDGDNTQTWGGTTYLVHAPIGGSMDPEAYGVNSGWGGLRAKPELVNLFGDPAATSDERAIFYTDGQSLAIDAIGEFTDGYAAPKWTNLRADGSIGADLTHPDTDYPLFRLAEAHLTYAECAARGASGTDRGRAVGYVNALRDRAFDGSVAAQIADADLTTDFVLDERARELYWEGVRRTDLRRFGRFTGADYVWAWKGGTQDGQAVPAFRGVYPIPASEIIANPNLSQNDGY